MDSSGLEVVRDKIDEDQDSENDALPEISEVIFFFYFNC